MKIKFISLLLFGYLNFAYSNEQQDVLVKLDLSEEPINLLLINQSEKTFKIQSSVVFNDCELQQGFCLEYGSIGSNIKKLFIRGGGGSYDIKLWPTDIWGKQLSLQYLKRLFPQQKNIEMLEFRINYFLKDRDIIATSPWYLINLKSLKIEIKNNS